MYKKLIAVLFVMAVSGLAGNAVAASVTLQQGLNGYSGCSDSFVNYGGFLDDVNENFGINQFLTVNSAQFYTG